MNDKNQSKRQAAPQISPYSILRALHKRIGLIGLVTIIGAIVTVVGVSLIPAIYTAEALILVESQRIPENFVAATVHADLEGRLNALRQQILSYTRLMEVIKKFDLYRNERPVRTMEEVVELMRADIKIAVQRGMVPGRPAAFAITYRGRNPAVAAQVSNLIASFFIDENLRTREVEAIGTSEFLDAQLAEARKRLEEQEQQLSDYKLRHTGELPQQENALIATISQARTQLTGIQDSLNRTQQNKLIAQTSLEAAEAQQAMLRRLTSAETPGQPAASATPLSMPAPPAPLRESERLGQQLEALRSRYAESHPDIIRTVAALARARELEARESSRTAGSGPAPSVRPAAPAPQQGGAQARMLESAVMTSDRIPALRAQIAGWERELAGYERERERLLQEIAGLQARISRLPVREQQLAAVTRDYENTRLNYKSLLDKKLSADVAANMERRQKAERFVMLEMARPPEKPSKPNKPMFYLGGSAFSLVLGMILGVGLELRRGILLGEWELPAGVVVIGRVPPISITPLPVAGRTRRPLMWCAAAAVSLVICLVGTGLYKGWLKF